MSALVAASAAGLLAGALHALAGADHLAAIAPLAASAPRRAWRAGFRWGLGHAGGVALVGALALAARGLVPVHALETWGERGVGVTLVAIGLWAMTRAFRAWPPAPAAAAPEPAGHGRAALAVGLLHGAAGGAHVLGIVPALALPTAGGAAAYLAAFGLGTVAAMTAWAFLVGTAARGANRAGGGARVGLLGGSGALSLAAGVAWLLP